jgi:hypothetical protein
MAQDPEPDEEQQDEGLIDPSHDLDMVPLFESSTVDAEIEADVIAGLLEANGIPTALMRPTGVPSLGYQLQVPRARREEALRAIQEAQAAGPEAAAEAEAASEEGI